MVHVRDWYPHISMKFVASICLHEYTEFLLLMLDKISCCGGSVDTLLELGEKNCDFFFKT